MKTLKTITTATFKMDVGDITFRLFDETPIQTTTFIMHAKSGNFKGMDFFRVEPGFIIQSGPKEGTAGGSMWDEIEPPRRIKDNNTHFFGILSAANAGSPNSSIGGYFICVGGRHNVSFLDKKYTSFGHIMSGWEYIEKIEKGDIVNDVIINTYTLN